MTSIIMATVPYVAVVLVSAGRILTDVAMNCTTY